MSASDLVGPVLDAAAQAATGNRWVRARPGQEQLAHDIARAMSGAGQVVGQAPVGVGKALALDTPVPTPSGWTAMGALRVGEEVFTDTGAVCRVTHAHPVRTGRACCEVLFDDGERIVADAEHLWQVRNAGEDTTPARETVVTTSELARMLALPGAAVVQVRVAGALDTSDAPLDVDPYEFGACCAGPVPEPLLRAGPAQRLALLQGLMDRCGLAVTTADGSPMTLCTVQGEPLAQDVADLVRSLGMRARMDTVRGPGAQVRHRVWFTPNTAVFRHPAKLAAQGPVLAGAQAKTVTAVNAVDSTPVRCITVDAPSGLFLAGRAMTVTHNSFAFAVPAMLRAACHGERTVVSTESLSLQAQVVDKDLPIVASAVKDATGVEVRFAVHKGWANLVCAQAAQQAALTLLEHQGMAVPKAAQAPTPAALSALAAMVGSLRVPARARHVDLGAGPVHPKDVVALVAWATRSVCSPHPGDADRARFGGVASDQQWSAMSVSPAECVGATVCTWGALCAPARARALAAGADVVVTNHSMLAVQATTRAPVIVGNRTLGVFEHIVIDEAHNLPAMVRAAGACEISARRVGSVLAAARRVIEDSDPAFKELTSAGDLLAQQVNARLDAVLRGCAPGAVKRLDEGQDPLDGLGAALCDWASRLGKLVAPYMGSAHVPVAVRARRASSRAEGLAGDVKAVTQHVASVARWAQRDDQGIPVVKASPVDVSGALRSTLWSAPAPYNDDGELAVDERRLIGPVVGDGSATDPDPEARYALSVTTISGTIPQGYAAQVGLGASTTTYPSPFAQAYAQSLLFVPAARTPDTVAALSGPGARPRLDVARHQVWAAPIIADLVNASGGRALVLAATSAAGRAYAQMLRQRFAHLGVYSQWDGKPTGALVAAWRAHTSSILVGTRSLMTGTDAPGDTCQLVIIDRCPRAASNPVDDARVQAARERQDVDRWTADRWVYVGDAALLLEQAAGRLVRSVTDRGVLAVLDPRLLKSGPLAYPAPTRTAYLRAVEAFTQRTTDLEVACTYLHQIGRHQVAA